MNERYTSDPIDKETPMTALVMPVRSRLSNRNPFTRSSIFNHRNRTRTSQNPPLKGNHKKRNTHKYKKN